jgi:alpha-amylase/alpha-mannosidase (GH57 family)
MTRVAILWHMHQPFYEDLMTHEHILPWVRLHALKDYYGMVALLREFPEVRVTFNLVPSLLVQLEAFAADRARDRYLELSLKPADELSDADTAFIVANFFHAQRQRMIEAYPRYNELLERRSASAKFSADDLRDLQVWHKLVWMDPSYLSTDGRILGLLSKGRRFTEDDKALLRTVELELLNRVIPEYRDAAARGQVEISTSPFYHPILPLLCDTDVYLRTHPGTNMPRRPFQHPDDAEEQLARAVACHERLFGHRPVGLWPSEGSVSDAMVPLVAKAGFSWMATDEQILAQSLGLTLTRDEYGHAEQPERLYRAYRVGALGADVADGVHVGCVFRDHVLSDRIGFVYSGWAPEVAADDFVGRLLEAGRRYEAKKGGGEAVVPIILDGENAWEHFEGGGRPFLRALYRRLSAHSELQTVTMADACAGGSQALSDIFPGSWIDANFYIWIGHRDDQQAWGQLADARDALDIVARSPCAGDAGPTALDQARAREEVLIAEGSDWFWWYGDDHSSDHDLEFDDLFRRHLRNVYRLLQKPVPEELFVTNISTVAAAPQEAPPSAWLAPTIDGEETSYFEWLAAGTIESRRPQGAMHQTSSVPPVLTRVQFGFGPRDLFVRLDGSRRMADLLAEGSVCSVTVLRPEARQFEVRRNGDAIVGVLSNQPVGGSGWTERGAHGARVAAGTILELALPLADLGAQACQAIAFFVSASRPAGGVVERHPANRPIEVVVPGGGLSGETWRG